MNKAKFMIILTVCLLFTGCREYGEKRIVKLITVDEENISLYCYDYTKDKPAYLKEEKANDGIENTLVAMLSEKEYDLKLCKYAVCDQQTARDKTAELYNAMMNTRFSPDIVIIEGDTKGECEKYIDLKGKNYPVYSYKTENGVTGIVEMADSNIKNVIISSGLYRTLDAEQSFLFDVLSNNIRNGTYSFKADNGSMSAELVKISAFYSVEKDLLNINISAELKSYKGMAANEKNKKQFIALLQRSLKSNAEHLLQDVQLADGFDLLWYRKVMDFDAIKINVNII